MWMLEVAILIVCAAHLGYDVWRDRAAARRAAVPPMVAPVFHPTHGPVK